MTIITYRGEEFSLIEHDHKCTKQNHCELCDFKQHCEDYIDENAWIACGCVFHSEPIYLKKLTENGTE